MERHLSSGFASIKPVTKPSWYSSYVIALLWGVALFRMVDMQIIAVVLEPIKAEFLLSDTQLGLLSGLAFALLYSLVGLPIAWCADRCNRVVIISCALAFWSTMTLLCGLVGSFFWFFLARLGVGLGEAGAYAPSASLLWDYSKKDKRGFAFAVLGSAIPVGVFVAFLFGGLINEFAGWRVVFIAVGIPGLLLAFILYLTVAEPDQALSKKNRIEKESAIENEKGRGFREALYLLFVETLSLLSNKSFCYLLAAASMTMLAATGSGIWMPSYYIRIHHLDLVTTGLMMAFLYGGGGVIGTLLGGVISDELQRHYKSFAPVLSACALSVLLALPMAMLMLKSGALWLVLGSHFIFIILIHFNVGPLLTAVQLFSGEKRRALGQSVNLLSSNLIGLGLGALLVGFISDKSSQVFGNTSLPFAILVVVSVGYLCAAWFFYKAAVGMTLQDIVSK